MSTLHLYYLGYKTKDGMFYPLGPFDNKGKFHLNDTGITAYFHGEYFSLGKKQGSFGYSVRKKKRRERS